MVDAGAASNGRAPRIPFFRLALVAVVLLGGISLTFVFRNLEADRAAQEADATADRAQALLTAIGLTIDASLAGTAGTVNSDGTVDQAAFEAFASELTSPAGLAALAFVQVVPAAEREAFEAQIGRPIIDRPVTGPVAAPERAEHYAVLVVIPATERSEQLIGFDLMGDPVRAATAQQARDAGTTVFSEPVPSEPTRTLSVFVIKPIYRLGAVLDTIEARRANLVGYASTTFLAEDIGRAMSLVLPEGTAFEIRDGESMLASASGGVDGGGTVRTAPATSRQWMISMDLDRSGSRGVPVMLGVLTLLMTAALVYEWVRSARRNRLERIDAQRSEELARLAGGLATLTSTDDVMTFLTTHVLAPLGASHAAVALIEGDILRRYFTPGDRSAATSRLLLDTVPRDADMPLAEAARTGQPVLVPDVALVRERYPHLVEPWTRLGFATTANLPLRDRTGELLGALGLAWDERVDLDELRGLMATVAGIAGQTIDRARLSDSEHRLVTALQEGLLTPMPAIDGLEIAQRYLPAVDDVGMGGDWYEGIALDDHRYLVVVGDIAGHGIAAVATMAQLRSTIGTIASLGTAVADILPLTAALPQHGALVVATVAVIEIDLRAGRVRYACAGHPPPLLRLPDGSVVVLDGGRQPLLGVAMPERVAGEHEFPVGSALVCFTDGLVERPGEAIDVSIDLLAVALEEAAEEAADGSADELAGVLLERSVPTPLRDDVALVVVRRTS